jgi:hypothetical protein
MLDAGEAPVTLRLQPGIVALPEDKAEQALFVGDSLDQGSSEPAIHAGFGKLSLYPFPAIVCASAQGGADDEDEGDLGAAGH